MAWRSRLDRFAPAHGWRSFLTELVIVVLGVLIALGAQQLVDTLRTEQDVADFRTALNAEMAGNLGAYQGRMMQSACLKTKLGQLEQWQRDWRDGDGPGIDGAIGRPLGYTLRLSVWRSGAGTAATHMPLDERLDYAAFYDDLDGYDGLRIREVATWQALFAYDGATRLSTPEVNALRGLILSARSTDRSMRLNWPDAVRQAAALGVRPKLDPAENGTGSGLCERLRFTR